MPSRIPLSPSGWAGPALRTSNLPPNADHQQLMTSREGWGEWHLACGNGNLVGPSCRKGVTAGIVHLDIGARRRSSSKENPYQ
uniref:Uncharacterized protein n=1 Tax=Bionectria ochroleuca TaxID=29856 RepID=A0A0B7JUI4_BIOOC